MKLRVEPLTVILAMALTATLIDKHIDKQEAIEKDHLQEEHSEELNAERALRLKHRLEMRKATKYRMRRR